MTINQPSFSSAMIILAIIFILFPAGVGILNAPVEFVLIVVTLVTAFYAGIMVRAGEILLIYL
ncbi:hypothetical protein [Shigella flexneri]|uniref:hypothetical protein n=1 Tax=Shigella flexneri TaxID=623 RepID=UPI002540D3CD|nr:hypothetical protein [Shigella flexneri]